MDHERIKVRTSIPSLQNKVQSKIEGPADIVYWYIRFNIQLDETSVSGKTMNVTDTDGYIMRTIITYNSKHNVISVSPLDTYEEGRFYLLNISKKVRSAKGKKLRSTIHILFKLLEGKVTDFKVLDKNTVIPTPKPRPKDYDARLARQKSSTPNHFERQYIDSSPAGKMSTVAFFVNPALGVLGLVTAGVGAFLLNVVIMAIGLVICMVGFVHIGIQLRDNTLRSKLQFNKGVRLFNRERYGAAEQAFRQALITDPDNKLAMHGVHKAELYRKA
jgi:hypothetical protein